MLGKIDNKVKNKSNSIESLISVELPPVLILSNTLGIAVADAILLKKYTNAIKKVHIKTVFFNLFPVLFSVSIIFVI